MIGKGAEISSYLGWKSRYSAVTSQDLAKTKISKHCLSLIRFNLIMQSDLLRTPYREFELPTRDLGAGQACHCIFDCFDCIMTALLPPA